MKGTLERKGPIKDVASPVHTESIQSQWHRRPLQSDRVACSRSYGRQVCSFLPAQSSCLSEVARIVYSEPDYSRLQRIVFPKSSTKNATATHRSARVIDCYVAEKWLSRRRRLTVEILRGDKRLASVRVCGIQSLTALSHSPNCETSWLVVGLRSKRSRVTRW